MCWNNPSGGTSSSLYRFNISSKQYSNELPQAKKRHQYGKMLYKNNKSVVIGGQAVNSNKVEILDLSVNTWNDSQNSSVLLNDYTRV